MLSDVFKDIYYAFHNLAYRFLLIANWFEDQGWPWSYLGAPFMLLYSISRDIGYFFQDAYKLTSNIEAFLDEIWSKAKQAYDYAYDVLRVRVNEALNDAGDAWDKAVTAYNKARDAWNYATGWLTDRANEAWSRAGAVWGTVTNYLKDKAIEAYNKAVWAYDQIGAAVTAQAQEIYAWVKSMPAEIRDYVAGVVAAIEAVTTDIVQSMIGLAMAAIAGPINLVNLWFDDIQNFFNSPLDWLESRFTDWFLGKEK